MKLSTDDEFIKFKFFESRFGTVASTCKRLAHGFGFNITLSSMLQLRLEVQFSSGFKTASP